MPPPKREGKKGKAHSIQNTHAYGNDTDTDLITHTPTSLSLSLSPPSLSMPKADKPTKAGSARAAAHPLAVKAASSKKKKKGSANTHHDASLGEEIQKLADPGKLKPMKASAAATKKKSASALEEQRLENQLRIATKHRKGVDAMEEDAEEDGFDEEADDEEEQMAADQAVQLSARMSKKILTAAHAQQKEEMEGEGEEEEKYRSEEYNTISE